MSCRSLNDTEPSMCEHEQCGRNQSSHSVEICVTFDSNAMEAIEIRQDIPLMVHTMRLVIIQLAFDVGRCLYMM